MRTPWLPLFQGLAVTWVGAQHAAPLHAQEAKPRVDVVARDADRRVDILVDGKPFTSYIYPTTLKKPTLYPVRAASGVVVTRGWPLEPRPGERVDHPHQVGLWFDYGDVNGLDFWNNSDAIPAARASKMGTILHRAVRRAEGVERLHLGALFRAIAVDHHRGGADEAKIPADAEQHERRPEMADRLAGVSDERACREQGQAGGDDPRRPEACDERAGNEARGEHGEHVPLDAERRIADGMAAIDHRERCGRHHQVHERIACNPARDGDDETGLARDVDKAAGTADARWRDVRRRAHLAEHQHGANSGRRLPEVARGEEVG